MRRRASGSSHATAPPSMAASISTSVTEAGIAGIPVRMNRMYRHQRHIYDLTRKFYLIGRVHVLDALRGAPGMAICGMGSGTGRNLIRLARRSSGTNLYGIDISSVMLATAGTAIQRAGFGTRVRLAESNIADFDPKRQFGVEHFDAVYFSYVLTMLPEWRPAVTRAIEVLRPGGTLAVVDFADQTRAAAPRRRILPARPAPFHLPPPPESETELFGLAPTPDAGHRPRRGRP